MDPDQRKEGRQHQGQPPFEAWQIDFTQVPKSGRWKYLFVFVDTFSGWVETCPTRMENAFKVVKALLRYIIPRFGLPNSLQSDNGPTFISEITKKDQ